MSVKSMAAIVAAVAMTVVAARDLRPAELARSPWLRNAVPVHEALPPGHPPIPGQRLPQGHPPVERAYPDLPPGHPPIPWAQPGCPGQFGFPDEGIGVGFGRDERAVIST
ncbi:MAG TPA: hypothetical protein VD737_07335 [Steroidobacteraceae bacterium]|nr:hypothetical protein [Steroidobacteraceae bacterium]